MKETGNMPTKERWPILQKLRASVPQDWKVEILPAIYLQEGQHTKDLLTEFGSCVRDDEWSEPGLQNEEEKHMVAYTIAKLQKQASLQVYSRFEQPEYQPTVQRVKKWVIENFEEWRRIPENELQFEEGRENS